MEKEVKNLPNNLVWIKCKHSTGTIRYIVEDSQELYRIEAKRTNVFNADTLSFSSTIQVIFSLPHKQCVKFGDEAFNEGVKTCLDYFRVGLCDGKYYPR